MKTKVLLLSALLLLLLTATVAAKPVITADSTYFDINSGHYVLNGNVRVEVGSRIITAGNARVSLTSREVWGYDGITVTQDDIYFTGDSVYVEGGRRSAQIDGSVNFSRSDLQISANQATYNWKTKLATFNGNVRVTQNGSTWTADSVEYNINTNTIL